MACPKGDTCDICGRPAAYEFHYRSWVAKLCGEHSKLAVPPILVFILRNEDVLQENN